MKSSHGGGAQFVEPAEGSKLHVSYAVPERLSNVLSHLAKPGALVLLIGEAGEGKSFLAVQAANSLAEQIGCAVLPVVLPVPPHAGSGMGSVFSTVLGKVLSENAAEAAEQVADTLIGCAGGRELVIVARGLDRLSAYDLAVLQSLSVKQNLRLIMTTRRTNGMIERIMQAPGSSRILVRPLSLDEADGFLSQMLGVERIDRVTLQQWHRVSGGNSFALTVLAIAGERAGAMRRGRGVAWVTSERAVLSDELVELVVEGCTTDELELLRFIAVAEPITEPQLLRRLNAVHLESLFSKQLVASQPGPYGAALVMGHSLLGASMRANMSPVLRADLNSEVFETLSAARAQSGAAADPTQLLRLVTFGIESGASLPVDWIWAALQGVTQGVHTELTLRLAHAIAVHPDATPAQAVNGLLRAENIARYIGDHGRLRSIVALMPRFERAEGVDAVQRSRLRVAMIRRQLWDDSNVAAALQGLDELEGELIEEAESQPADLRDQLPIAAVRSARVLVLGYSGRLLEAVLAGPPAEISEDIGIEWVRSSARAVVALIEAQNRGTHASAEQAIRGRKFGSLGSWAEYESIEMQGFSWLLSYWSAGDTLGARRVLESLEAEVSVTDIAETPRLVLIDAGRLLVDALEGRWLEVAQSTEYLSEDLERHDGFGLAPLVQAMRGVSLAVLGDEQGARRAIREATPRTGIAQALAGVYRLNLLRALQWLRDEELEAAAWRLANWARGESLALIELNALHVVAFEGGQITPELLERVERLRFLEEQPVGAALLTHLDWIVENVRGRASDMRGHAGTLLPPVRSEEPDLRALADLGIWLPLPLNNAPDLTAREREVAMLAARGHTSRFIAERLQISVRTVDTHLSRVFMKLGIGNRDELWQWAARQRSLRHSSH